MTYLQQQQPPGPVESRAGPGAGDHDRPYQFGPTSRASRLTSGAPGWRPRTSLPNPIAHASTHACWSSAADSRTEALAKSRQMAPAQLSRLPERGHMSTKVQARYWRHEWITWSGSSKHSGLDQVGRWYPSS